jgi:hypothetical protein
MKKLLFVFATIFILGVGLLAFRKPYAGSIKGIVVCLQMALLMHGLFRQRILSKQMWCRDLSRSRPLNPARTVL